MSTRVSGVPRAVTGKEMVVVKAGVVSMGVAS